MAKAKIKAKAKSTFGNARAKSAAARVGGKLRGRQVTKAGAGAD